MSESSNLFTRCEPVVRAPNPNSSGPRQLSAPYFNSVQSGVAPGRCPLLGEYVSEMPRG